MRIYHRLALKVRRFFVFLHHKTQPMADNKNSGALFKNDRKQKETEPDYKGTINIEGVEFYLSAWVNESARTGQKYFAIKATPKAATAPATTTATAQHQTSTIADPVDDLPF